MDLKVKPYNLLNTIKGEDYIFEGNIFYNANNFLLAIEMYSIAIKGSDVNPVAYFNRGCSYMAVGLFERATDDFSEYLKHNQNDEEARNQLALAQSLGRRTVSVIKTL